MKFLTSIVIVILFVIATGGQAQTCTCESNFEWLKKTFEENDAGFQYIIDKKGQRAYDVHNQLMIKKSKSAQNLTECAELLNEWLKFFRSGHIGITRLTNEIPNKEDTYKWWNIDIPQFEKYISEKTEVDYEGIWTTESLNKIGIKKEGADYVAFIIDTIKNSVRVILTIIHDGDKQNATYYALSRSPYKIPNPNLIGNNTLQFGEWGTWKRLSPAFPEDTGNSVVDEGYIKFMLAEKTYLDELNPTTLYLRILSFDPNQKNDIDSVITANRDKILSTENLIIDIRNSTGGGDISYQELLPFLYTNPIRKVLVEFLSTELNNQQIKDFLHNTELNFDEETRKQYREYYDTLQSGLGKFVNLFGMDVYIERYDTIYEYPKNVGIIINHRNLSTDEQFLLDAKQSKKVKLFGTTTMGALDISNMREVNSPCGEFQLHYGASRSLRIPDMVIDEIGIQPDYFLDKSIPPHKWVEFVNGILNQ